MATILELLSSLVLEARPDKEDYLRTLIDVPLTSIPATFSAISRDLGGKPLAPGSRLATTVEREGYGWVLHRLRVDLAARMYMLAGRFPKIDSKAEGVIGDLYTKGDTAERCAIARSLSLLHTPATFLDIARDACRSNIQLAFEGVAVANPYPRDWFSEQQFNQMVLKCIYLNVPLRDVIGLTTRQNDDLTRMVRDYTRERSLAGRSIHPDVHLIANEV